MGAIVTNRRAIATPESILANTGAADQIDGAMQEKTATATLEQPSEQPKEIPKEVRFVKNLFPGERITFKDGTTFRFPQSLFVCSDPALIAKILEVADRYYIVTQ